MLVAAVKNWMMMKLIPREFVGIKLKILDLDQHVHSIDFNSMILGTIGTNTNI